MLVAALTGSAGAVAHPGLNADVERLTRELERAPSAELYLRRSAKQRLLERYAEALADVERAEARGAPKTGVAYERGLSLAASGKTTAALDELDRFLALGGRSFEVHRVRGRLLEALDRFGEARLDFERAFELAPDPETCLELARFQERRGWPDDARRTLEAGLARLDGAVTLRHALIGLLRRTGQTQAALAQARAAASGQAPAAQLEWRIVAAEVLIDRHEVAAARQELLAVRAELDRALARRRNGLYEEAREQVTVLLASLPGGTK